ncbi:PREDICTED: PP2A regulatory subunit TAP46 isoform X2 [Tarenaya hassleriana]|uniref:PP2A regulatory subunit TAP46 isoform X2 n=1 Tax=Tarenaya hassleriana TaxID=28532 RepID=UPI00053C08C4|nr:PREDICTED: PP2A regulatory subunit TAP46 isoform X2 [Tarenaya hassleriana]
MEEMSLPTLFEKSRKIHLAASESGIDQDLVKKGCEMLRKSEDMIGKLGLFSSNETKDDISTTNLKYLLVPFYLAELTEKIAQDDRSQIVKASQAKLKEFLSFCEAMELVPDEELQASSRGGSVPPADRRALKIARFKRQKAAESKLLEIKERKERRGRSTKAAAVSAPVEAGEEDTPDDDSEEEREAWLITISLATCKALDLMEMLKKEEEMLSAMKEKQEGENGFSKDALDERTKKAEAWHRDAAARAQYSKPAQPITCATFAQDVIEGRASVSQAHEHKHQPLIFGPASLVNGPLSTERERMAAQVFQPTHRMPTMSIEEAGLTEMRIMNNWQESTKQAIEEANSSWYNDKPLRRKEEDGEEEEDEEAVMRARAFDDWKDDNPRGAGNKKLTPCG